MGYKWEITYITIGKLSKGNHSEIRYLKSFKWSLSSRQSSKQTHKNIYLELYNSMVFFTSLMQ